MNDDELLRRKRLVFYEEDIARIDRILASFLVQSKAKCALLVDKEGHMVTHQGKAAGYDTDTISALVAGSFAATRAMAKLLGEEEFSLLFHQGRRDNIQMSLIGDRTLLVVIFDDTTTLGMVKLYAAESSTQLTQVFAQRATDAIARPAPAKAAAPTAAEAGEKAAYDKEAQQSLDDLFGDG